MGWAGLASRRDSLRVYMEDGVRRRNRRTRSNDHSNNSNSNNNIAVALPLRRWRRQGQRAGRLG